MIYKYWKEKNNIVNLEKYEMVDISNDLRTKMLNKEILTSKLYKIEKNLFFVRQEFFIYMGNLCDQPNAKSLYIKYEDGKEVVITDDTSHIFYNGKSIEPEKYKLPISKDMIKKMIKPK
jgi:hypothetical protein